MTNASITKKLFGWNDHKSIMLTKFATLAVAMGCVVMVLCGPRIVSWVLAVHALQLVHGPKLGYFLLGLGYCSAALALWMLYNLYMFLARIEKKRCLPLPTCWPCGASAGAAPGLQRSACRWVLCWGCRSSLPLALRRRLWR